MKTILVVDDNPLNRDLASAMLQRSGLSAIVAESARRALELLATTPVDVVVTDIGMPEMNGIELCEEICRRYGHDRPRLVALTSFGMQAERDRIVAAGFDALVTKPASRRVLTAAVAPADEGLVA